MYIDLYAYVLKIMMALIHMHVVPGHDRVGQFFSAFGSGSSGERVPGKTYAATADLFTHICLSHGNGWFHIRYIPQIIIRSFQGSLGSRFASAPAFLRLFIVYSLAFCFAL